MRTLYIKRKKFLEWYFDNDMTEEIGETVRYNLIHSGNFKITDNDILDGVVYIPTEFVINQDLLTKKELEDEELDFSIPSEYKFKGDEI
jgi:hypothetical protein